MHTGEGGGLGQRRSEAGMTHTIPQALPPGGEGGKVFSCWVSGLLDEVVRWSGHSPCALEP